MLQFKKFYLIFFLFTNHLALFHLRLKIGFYLKHVITEVSPNWYSEHVAKYNVSDI